MHYLTGCAAELKIARKKQYQWSPEFPMLPLFEAFPRLEQELTCAALANLPTQISPMTALEKELGVSGLYIKRDDLSGNPYGGNKVRKLDFLLGRAMREGRRAVMTFGAAGSNHALATAIYARQLGLISINMLMPQTNAHSVRRNLLMSLRTGAELHYFTENRRLQWGVIQQMARHRLRDGVFPMQIPPGGSSPLGAVGFVNAAFELRKQVERGLLPEPHYIYAASGTMGTAIGLALGCAAAGLRSKIMAVCVTSPPHTSPEKGQQLFRATNDFLQRLDSSFPKELLSPERFELVYGFLGEKYGVYTEEAVAAVRQIKAAENIKLEGTYTGKAFAALLEAARSGTLKGKTTLFWNTYNGWDFSPEIQGLNYSALPKALHKYFEEEVQPLDRQP